MPHPPRGSGTEASCLPPSTWRSCHRGALRRGTSRAALFALASLTAGLAPNLETLIAARFAQGAGGLVVGVLLSGVIVQLLDWRRTFGINVPLAAIVIALTPMLVRADGSRVTDRRLDLS